MKNTVSLFLRVSSIAEEIHVGDLIFENNYPSSEEINSSLAEAFEKVAETLRTTVKVDNVFYNWKED